ncbi:Phage gp6-like head-tail connector protein [Streptococcus pneumoniae]|nr:Phage gp6-like head-tail connector protein [Streptococcus pneumoniae]VLL68678.1 Phage gp6-like head-tail connector protein [Streptococcus pneumoniae]VLY52726.1 Phage gp6-like head-tail connector protein [Streptococcus pneumoniae]VME55476.1 Phage gp6-like head-tail connector protein [Streptococcus pneumoniae]VMJ56861.1 Phage gp6-like head-tail connector protein [Streptococcus pneumoniae]
MSIELLKKLTGEEDTQLLMLIQTRATNLILSETNRTSLTPALSLLIPEVAIELHNRSGAEGERSRTEGVYGENGLSTGLLQRIRMHRLARVAGHVFEAE